MKYCWFVFFTLLLTVHTLKSCSPDCLTCDFLTGNCLHCLKGLYLSTDTCVENCTDNLYADNYSMTCKKMNDSPVYIKAFTFSRCINSCGMEFHDCSCKENCKLSGTCCSDFKFCEIVEENHVEVEILESKCKKATIDEKICLQCKENFYLYNTECHDKCPQGTIPNEDNKICILTEKCAINNKNTCEKCDYKGKCIDCVNGHFLHRGECIKKCPKGFKANRENFECQPEDQYSFHWVYPSHTSCKNNCNNGHLNSTLSQNTDCSCKSSCSRKGNCCDDYELYCKKSDSEEKMQNLHEHLLASFKKTFNFANLNNNVVNTNNTKSNSFRINGNSNVNLYLKNKNMQIKNSNKINRNSHNVNIEDVENRDSHNLIHQGHFNLKTDFGLNLNFELENKKLHSLLYSQKNKEMISLDNKNKKINSQPIPPPNSFEKKLNLPTKSASISDHPDMNFNIKKEHVDVIRTIPKQDNIITSTPFENVKQNVTPIIITQNETEKIVNNNYEVHNHIFINDYSLNLINSLHSKLFLLNKTGANKSGTDHQILIGNETFFNKYNLTNLKSNNMIIINQGDVSRNITNNKINEDKPFEKKYTEKYGESDLNKSMNDFSELNKAIKKLNDEINIQKVPINEKKSTEESKFQILKPKIEKIIQQPLVGIKNETEPKIEIIKPKIEEITQQPLVGIKNVTEPKIEIIKPKIEEIMQQPLVEEKNETEPKIEEIMQQPIVEVKNVTEPKIQIIKPKIEEIMQQPLVEVKNVTEPKIEIIKPKIEEITQQPLIGIKNETETKIEIIKPKIQEKKQQPIEKNETKTKIEEIKQQPMAKQNMQIIEEKKPETISTQEKIQPKLVLEKKPLILNIEKIPINKLNKSESTNDIAQLPQSKKEEIQILINNTKFEPEHSNNRPVEKKQSIEISNTNINTNKTFVTNIPSKTTHDNSTTSLKSPQIIEKINHDQINTQQVEKQISAIIINNKNISKLEKLENKTNIFEVNQINETLVNSSNLKNNGHFQHISELNSTFTKPEKNIVEEHISIKLDKMKVKHVENLNNPEIKNETFINPIVVHPVSEDIIQEKKPQEKIKEKHENIYYNKSKHETSNIAAEISPSIEELIKKISNHTYIQSENVKIEPLKKSPKILKNNITNKYNESNFTYVTSQHDDQVIVKPKEKKPQYNEIKPVISGETQFQPIKEQEQINSPQYKPNLTTAKISESLNNKTIIMNQTQISPEFEEKMNKNVKNSYPEISDDENSNESNINIPQNQPTQNKSEEQVNKTENIFNIPEKFNTTPLENKSKLQNTTLNETNRNHNFEDKITKININSTEPIENKTITIIKQNISTPSEIKPSENFKNFSKVPEKKSDGPSMNIVFNQSTLLNPLKQNSKSKTQNETSNIVINHNKTQILNLQPKILSAEHLINNTINLNLTQEEKNNFVVRFNTSHHETKNLTNFITNKTIAHKDQHQSNQKNNSHANLTNIKENNLTITPKNSFHNFNHEINKTHDVKDNHIKIILSKSEENKTIILTKPYHSSMNVTNTNKTKFDEEKIYTNNQSNYIINVSYSNNTHQQKPKTEEKSKDEFLKIKVIKKSTNTTEQKLQLKTTKEIISCMKDDLCIRCDKEMKCNKCKLNSYYNLIDGKCKCNIGYYYSIEHKKCLRCHPLCNECKGGSKDDCLNCGVNAEKIDKDSNECACKAGYIFDKVLEMCLTPSDVLVIKHTKPKSCKGNNYWEPRISECVEPIENRTKEMKFATVLYLGGNQSPEDLSEGGLDILKQHWDSSNDITSGGIRQNFISGLYFKEKFINFYNLTGAKFNPDMVKVSSSSKKAAIKGSYSFLLGLMPTLENVNDKEFYDPKFYIGKYKNNLTKEETESISYSYSSTNKKTIKKNKNLTQKISGSNKNNKSLSNSHNLNSANSYETHTNMKPKRIRLQEIKNIDKTYSQNSSFIQKNSSTHDTPHNSKLTIKNKKNSKNGQVKQTGVVAIPENKKKVKTYTHEELDKIKLFEGKNPFQSDNETEILFEDVAPVLPMVPSHTPMQSFSKDYGISDLSICIGAQEYIKRNTEINRIKAEKIIEKIGKKIDIHQYFKIPKNITISPELMKNLTHAFFYNYNVNNKNLTRKNIPKSAKKMFQEFNDLQIYGNLFGDKHNYIAKAVLTPYAEQFLQNVNDEINHEFKSVVKSMKKYYKHGKLDLNPLGEFKKLDFFFPDQQIFWAMMAFMSRLKGEQIPIPLSPAGVSFELSKNKMEKFNLTKYILKYNQFIYPDNKAGKSNSTMISESSLDKSVYSQDLNEGKNKKIKNSKNKTEKIKNNRIEFSGDNNKKKEKDSKDSKDSKDYTKKSQKKEISNLIINNYVNLMLDLNNKFNNPNLYYVKVYFNHELIFDQSYLAFREKLKEFIVNKEELREFCFPPKTDIWLIICMALFTCLVFQLLIIACLYTIKN